MLAALLPRVARAWFTAPPNSRALSPAALQSLARQLGYEETVSEPRRRRARPGARNGPSSTTERCSQPARCTSSARCSARSSAGRRPGPSCGARHDERQGPSVLTMIGGVALLVALVILVFFAAGYGFGRLFL